MSSIRITGMSGIDTEKMITDIMKAERVKVDNVQQDRQIVQWRQELYNSINKDFANFILNSRKEFGLSVITSTGSIDSKSLSSLSWVKRAISSNEGAVKASTTSQAVNGSYDVTVHRLADGVKGASSVNADEAIKDILSNLSDAVIEDGEVISPSETFDIKINGETITVKKGDTMSSIVKNINSSGAGVQASYDAAIGRFFIQTTATGKDAELKIEAAQGSKGEEFINALSLNVTSYNADGTQKTAAFKFEDSPYNGVNALIDFNGATGIEQQSNQFTINGINLDLRTTGSTTIRVDTDTDAVYDKIKGFVDKYNELVDKMGKLLGEKKYRDFKPLTSEQKEAMKEKEVELWEEKAKSGLLRNDSIISSIMQNVRGSLYHKVEGLEDNPFNSLYQLGIETEGYVPGEVGGKLKIDEEKLRKAISEDANGVLEVLFKEADTTTKNGKTVPVKNSGGVITRVFNNMIDGMEDIIGKAGPGEDSSLYRSINTRLMLDFVTEHSSISLLDKDLTSLDRRISDLNAQLLRKEESYYSKFSAMERFVQQMNNQGSWMMQQLGM
ncbi:flagellar filament capping protein FliD [Proteiniborus sp. MB09-C3]|uniref:flagellar filament capping protein FliD n=1 Tax=Proteiniborus sp. MB09-C3 TaxID=3050072 RepID=UPI002555E8BD|nr:flagellar filament capping protein FliD [Proteiniborus sp. MB09-C3]WIV12018.1 flagellar filament capping protein FliD [Proteiniborus sp. MB09-C3]